MLGLATHEANFTIIREEFKPNKPRPCALCGQLGHEIKDCQGTAREKQGEVRPRLYRSHNFEHLPAWLSDILPLEMNHKSSISVFQHDEFADSMPVSEQEFIFIRLCVLREVQCSFISLLSSFILNGHCQIFISCPTPVEQLCIIHHTKML